ncbi:uncharacterized protein [Triticum aestivum]|uniref:uncharacterized protein n=1 Tax=Triticum aestivum TaxID=4565 RepID=UPI001D001EDA|nr:uncharacterized protein LOC123046100 [Triticum aestivum]
MEAATRSASLLRRVSLAMQTMSPSVSGSSNLCSSFSTVLAVIFSFGPSKPSLRTSHRVPRCETGTNVGFAACRALWRTGAGTTLVLGGADDRRTDASGTNGGLVAWKRRSGLAAGSEASLSAPSWRQQTWWVTAPSCISAAVGRAGSLRLRWPTAALGPARVGPKTSGKPVATAWMLLTWSSNSRGAETTAATWASSSAAMQSKGGGCERWFLAPAKKSAIGSGTGAASADGGEGRGCGAWSRAAPAPAAWRRPELQRPRELSERRCPGGSGCGDETRPPGRPPPFRHDSGLGACPSRTCAHPDLLRRRPCGHHLREGRRGTPCPQAQQAGDGAAAHAGHLPPPSSRSRQG